MLSLKKIFFVLMLTCLIVNSVFGQTSNPQQYKYVFTVAKDGSGDYKYIQDAIGAGFSFSADHSLYKEWSV